MQRQRNRVVVAYQWCNKNSKQQRNDVCPDRESNVLLYDNNEADNEADHKDENIPPPWRFLVFPAI